MKTARFLIVPVVLWAAVCFAPLKATAAWDDYDDSQANPLRVLAYTIYPVGVLFEWVLFRPFHALVSGTKPQEEIFGHRPHPAIFADPEPGYDFGVSKRPATPSPRVPRAAIPQEPVSEKVTIQQVPVEKILYKEVPKFVEVEKIIFPDIAFRFDSSELTDLGKGKIYLIAQKIKEKSDVLVSIEGHTDYVGSEEYNQRLGLRRAQRVMKELADLGIDPSRVSVSSMGESKPLVDQQTEWARAVNRRVEFTITPVK
jgi:outer membrane protein OmpA-like peptidoglycan-associated protein